MKGDDAAFGFAILGLDERSADEQGVQSAFRRLALTMHPDKVGADGSSDFATLSDARDRALASLADARRRRAALAPPWWAPGGSGSPSCPSDWAVYVACEAMRRTTAFDVEIDLDVSLDDLYHGRTKKVVLQVLRARDRTVGGFRRTRQTVLVCLLQGARDRAVADGPPLRFAGVGDDPPSALIGGPAGTRGDVVVRVRLRLDGAAMRPDPVLWPCDLHASVSVPLSARYRGADVRLGHPGGQDACARYRGQWDEGGDDEEPTGAGTRQVRVLEGWGLPYRADTEAGSRGRGDLYVFMDVRMPSIPARSEAAERALDVLDMLDSNARALALCCV
jgi:hypothetical protein